MASNSHLSMNPLKQGLKHLTTHNWRIPDNRHLSMNPLKQGLKLLFGLVRDFIFVHLSMNPLKQGLKLAFRQVKLRPVIAFIHESIKTRVETPTTSIGIQSGSCIYP